jgi:hypothetical protein
MCPRNAWAKLLRDSSSSILHHWSERTLLPFPACRAHAGAMQKLTLSFASPDRQLQAVEWQGVPVSLGYLQSPYATQLGHGQGGQAACVVAR